MIKGVSLLLFSFILLCATEQRVIPLRTLFQTEVSIKNKPYNVWLALNPKQQEEGLSHLDSNEVLAEEGMLFVYPYNEKLSFWMKETLFDIDIAYLNEAGEVVDVYTMKKRSLKAFDSTEKVRYALEFQAGVLKRVGLKRGEKIVLPSFVKELAKP